jgi:hypothetical protein
VSRCVRCDQRITDSGWVPFCCEVCWDSTDAEERRLCESGLYDQLFRRQEEPQEPAPARTLDEVRAGIQERARRGLVTDMLLALNEPERQAEGTPQFRQDRAAIVRQLLGDQ